MAVKFNVDTVFFDYVTVDEVDDAVELEKKGAYHYQIKKLWTSLNFTCCSAFPPDEADSPEQFRSVKKYPSKLSWRHYTTVPCADIALLMPNNFSSVHLYHLVHPPDK